MDASNDTLTIGEALARYYAAHGLPADGGESSAWFVIRVGPLRIPLPNPPMRKNAVLYHDIHHLVTGFNTVFSEGEMIIAGHEVGAGCGRFAVAWIINLWMFALGLLVRPRQLFAAFVRGRQCDSLYRNFDERRRFLSMTITQMKHMVRLDRSAAAATMRDALCFAGWSVIAWAAILLPIAIAAAAWLVVWAA